MFHLLQQQIHITQVLRSPTYNAQLSLESNSWTLVLTGLLVVWPTHSNFPAIIDNQQPHCPWPPSPTYHLLTCPYFILFCTRYVKCACGDKALTNFYSEHRTSTTGSQNEYFNFEASFKNVCEDLKLQRFLSFFFVLFCFKARM